MLESYRPFFNSLYKYFKAQGNKVIRNKKENAYFRNILYPFLKEVNVCPSIIPVKDLFIIYELVNQILSDYSEIDLMLTYLQIIAEHYLNDY